MMEIKIGKQARLSPTRQNHADVLILFYWLLRELRVGR